MNWIVKANRKKRTSNVEEAVVTHAAEVLQTTVKITES